ncbi:MAG: MFS transporter [Polaromonas sp.]|nr:MFS transporter [Polaromonas sp.]
MGAGVSDQDTGSASVNAKGQLFYTSLFFSRLADQILLFLVPLVVFETTGSVAWSGIAFTLETLPRFLSFPICGALCDRISPLKLLRISQLFRALVCLAGVVAFQWAGGVGWLIALSAVCGVLTTQGLMAREVMLPQIFRQHRFEKVLAHAQIADQLGMVLGPLLASLLLRWMPWPMVVGATAGFFLIADGAITLWQRQNVVTLAAPEPAPGHWAAPIPTAFSQVMHLPGLKQVIALAAGVNLIIGVTLATSAAMVTGLLQRTAGDYAVLQTAGAIATVIILLFIARTVLSLRTLGLVSYTAMVCGGLLTGLAGNFWVYTVGFLLVIGFDKMFNVYIRSLRQKLIPPRDLGKTTGVIVMLNNLSQPLAGMLVGVFAGVMEGRGVILGLVGVMGLIGGLVAWMGRGR